MALNKLFSSSRFKTLYIFSDGAVREKPPAASAAVIVKNKKGQILEWFSRVLPHMSNNEAEYRGLLEGLELALRLRPEKVLFHLDSQIVVGQVTGRFAARSNKLKNLCRQSREKLAELEKQGIQPRLLFVPREYNLLADALAADALLVIPEHKFNLPEISVTEEEV